MLKQLKNAKEDITNKWWPQTTETNGKFIYYLMLVNVCVCACAISGGSRREGVKVIYRDLRKSQFVFCLTITGYSNRFLQRSPLLQLGGKKLTGGGHHMMLLLQTQ